MEGEPAPDFDLSDLTVDQHGMLELLGSPRIVAYRLLEYHLEPPRIDGVPNISRVRVIKHLCPVVRVLGRDRVILANGDVSAELDGSCTG